MLRKDGCYTIYRLQVRTMHGNWQNINFDRFGYPYGFGGNDVCYQAIGIHATFYPGIARAAARELTERHPEYQFRVIKQNISQFTSTEIRKE